MPDSIGFSAVISFEHDKQPVMTIRMELDKPDFEAAFKSAVFQAMKSAPKWTPRSIVVCMERLA